MEIVILACKNKFHVISHAFAGKTDNKTKDVKEKLKQAFKVEMPQDFFDFWEVCKTLKSENPCGKSGIYFVLFCLPSISIKNCIRPNPIILCKLVYQLARESTVC